MSQYGQFCQKKCSQQVNGQKFDIYQYGTQIEVNQGAPHVKQCELRDIHVNQAPQKIIYHQTAPELVVVPVCAPRNCNSYFRQ